MHRIARALGFWRPQFRSKNHNCESIIPSGLAKKVVALTCKSPARNGVCNVVLVGAVHNSPKSCDLVEEVINVVKPEVVFLELCRKRKGQCYGIFPRCVLEVARKFRVCRMNEFRMAYEEATKYGAKVILGDRDIDKTDRRLPSDWDSVGHHSLDEALERVVIQNDLDLDEIAMHNQQWGKLCPTEVEVLVHERDRYMSSSLMNLAGKHNSVVAVVGKAHLPGITSILKRSIQARELLETSVQKPVVPESMAII